MAESKQFSIKRRAGKTRGSRGKKRSNKQPSTTAATSLSPPRSASPLPLAQAASRSVLGPVLDNECRCHKPSTYTSSATQTIESAFAGPSTPISTTTTASPPPSPTFAASSSSTDSTPSSCPPRRSSDTFSVLIDLPLTTAELQGWERGIKAARSPVKRSQWSKMLQDEIRQRGIEGMGEDMVELVLKQY